MMQSNSPVQRHTKSGPSGPATATAEPSGMSPVQRKALAGMPYDAQVRALAPEPEAPVQRKGAGGAAAPGQAKGGGGGGDLPVQLKAGIESLSGVAMDDVKVVSGSSKPAEVGAQATTQGSEIHLGPGQQQHLAHEAWHVVQQKQGRVGTTTAVGGTPVNDDASLEAEADAMGARAQSVGASGGAGAAPVQRSAAGAGAPVQRKIGYEFEANTKLRQNANPNVETTDDSPAYNKGGALVKRDHLELQADTNPITGSCIEFVSDAFDVSKQGRKQMTASLDRLEKWSKGIDGMQKRVPRGTLTFPYQNLNKAVSGVGDDVKAAASSRAMQGGGQVSAGLTLEELDGLLQEWVGDDGKSNAGSSSSSSSSKKKKGPAPVTAKTFFQAIGNKPEAYKEIVRRMNSAEFVTRAPQDDEAGSSSEGGSEKAPLEVTDRTPVSPGLRSLVWLVGSYLLTVHNDPRTKMGKAFANSKEVSVLLSRNNFGALFKMLPAKEQEILGDDPELLVKAVGISADVPMGDLIYPCGFEKGGKNNKREIKFPLTRGDWVRGICAGKDMLTKEYWESEENAGESESVEDQPDPMKESGKELHKSLGAYKNPDRDRGYEQAVFEFRKIKGGQTPYDFAIQMRQAWDQLESKMRKPPPKQGR